MEDAHGQDSGRDGKRSQLRGQERWSQECSPPLKRVDGTSAMAWFYLLSLDSIKPSISMASLIWLQKCK